MKEYLPEDSVVFVSILDEDWTGRFNGNDYLIKARESKPYRLVVAEHFAKHMADLVLQREYDLESKKEKDKEKRNRARLWIDPRRYDLYKQMIPELVELIDQKVEELRKSGASR